MTDYLLFTYPNCEKCEALKKHLLAKTDWRVEEYNLAKRESKQKIREFLAVLERDEKGGIRLPALIVRDESRVIAVIHNEEELTHCLQSRG
jgi:glutaredoxin